MTLQTSIHDLMPDFEIDRQDIKLLQVIGEGSSAVVHKCQYKGIDAAAKQFVNLGLGSHQFVEEALREFSLMRSVRCSRIVQGYGVYADSKTATLVTELMETSVAELAYRKELSLDESISIAVDLFEALSFLAASHIIHRDVKPENVLLDRHRRAKLSDVGLAHILMDSETSIFSTKRAGAGTRHYMAPEQYDSTLGMPMTVAADVYSGAATVLAMVTGQAPYAKLGEVELMAAIFGKKLVPPELEMVKQEDLRKLLIGCMAFDSVLRPSAQFVLNELHKIRAALPSQTTSSSLPESLRDQLAKAEEKGRAESQVIIEDLIKEMKQSKLEAKGKTSGAASEEIATLTAKVQAQEEEIRRLKTEIQRLTVNATQRTSSDTSSAPSATQQFAQSADQQSEMSTSPLPAVTAEQIAKMSLQTFDKARVPYVERSHLLEGEIAELELQRPDAKKFENFNREMMASEDPDDSAVGAKMHADLTAELERFRRGKGDLLEEHVIVQAIKERKEALGVIKKQLDVFTVNDPARRITGKIHETTTKINMNVDDLKRMAESE